MGPKELTLMVNLTVGYSNLITHRVEGLVRIKQRDRLALENDLTRCLTAPVADRFSPVPGDPDHAPGLVRQPRLRRDERIS